MATTRCQDNFARCAGLTLIEVLLVVLMLLMLSAVMVYNYSQLGSAGALEEGTRQLATALRHARAEAANTGRRVRIEVVADSETTGLPEALEPGTLRVTWEPHPLKEPGVFIELVGPAWADNLPVDLIAVEKAQRLTVPSHVLQSGERIVVSEVIDRPVFEPVTFYPDGSCDAMRYTVVSRRGEDHRRGMLELSGLTGGVRWWLFDPTLSREVESWSDVAGEDVEQETDWLEGHLH